MNYWGESMTKIRIPPVHAASSLSADGAAKSSLALPTFSHPQSNAKSSLLFNAYVISLMTLIWSSHALLLRHTRTNLKYADQLYFPSTVVVCSEACKLFASVLLLWNQHKFRVSKLIHEIRVEFIGRPKELLKMSVPALLYAVQNNLDFVALANLEPGVYQVTCQFKIVTTAAFMVLMLQKRYSLTRWVSIVLLFCGVALVQLQAVQNSNAESSDPFLPHQNHFVGLAAVLTTCLTAGFSGVYFEKMLKDSTTSLWIRNMQMYFCGLVCAGATCLLNDGSNLMSRGFFYGYYDLVYVIIALLSLGGIYISMVIKYLDNLMKSFASAASILFVSMLSVYLFGSVLSFTFIVGSVVVILSILLYNYVAE